MFLLLNLYLFNKRFSKVQKIGNNLTYMRNKEKKFIKIIAMYDHKSVFVSNITVINKTFKNK